VFPVSIGQYTIYAGGGMYLTQNHKEGFDLLVDLRDEKIPREINFGTVADNYLYLPIVDYQTVSEGCEAAFRWHLLDVYLRIRKGERVLVYCAGGHGRTGLFLASLLALVEPEIKDPVAELRRRYCSRAVETPEQEAQVASMHSVAREIHEALKGQ
jgi:protein-tyrosine phosphatase